MNQMEFLWPGIMTEWSNDPSQSGQRKVHLWIDGLKITIPRIRGVCWMMRHSRDRIAILLAENPYSQNTRVLC